MNKLTSGTLTPAYGRDYKSKAEVEKAFRDGKDFQYNSFNGSGYCSINDFAPGSKVQLRYKNIRSVTVVTV
jgi:hypothetical protein